MPEMFISKTGKVVGSLADKALRTKESLPGNSRLFSAGCPSQGCINVRFHIVLSRTHVQKLAEADIVLNGLK